MISGLTLSADACLYQSDCSPRLGLNFSEGGLVNISPVVTENIGLPFSATSFVGRDKPLKWEKLGGLLGCKTVEDLRALAHLHPLVQVLPTRVGVYWPR